MGNQNTRLGYGCAITAQVVWGLLPIYVDFLKNHDEFAVVGHRIIWAFVSLLGIFAVSRLIRNSYLPSLDDLKAGFQNRTTLWICFAAALLILTNWVGFIWAVLNNHKLDASLGYYICPQVVVLLGVIFERERLGRMQWIGFSLTALGVLYMVGSSASMPSVSLALAFSFGFYALLKKRVNLTALSGLTLETGFLFVPALLFFAFACDWMPIAESSLEPNVTGRPAIFTTSWQLNLLLIGSGLVTILPLSLYATAVKHIPLSVVGLLQFIGPTIQFGLGVFLYHEQLDRSRLIGFIIVWLGVIIYLASLRTPRKPVA